MVEEAGLETDGMAETTSQLQAKLKALTDGKVDIMVDANNFKNTTQILREMAAEWENLTDVEQAAALELLGGKRQANTLAAILTNFDIVEDTIEASANSAGSAMEENAKVLDSIQGRINQFNNTLQTMWNDELNSNLIKGIVDLGTELIKLVDILGLIPTLLIAISAKNIVPNLLMAITSAETFGAALSTILKPLVQIKGVGSTLGQFFAQTAAEAMNASGGVATFGAYLKAAGKTLTAFFNTPLGWFTAIAAAIALTVHLIDVFTTSTEELQEELSNLQSELRDIQSELDSVNSELETTQDRIAELLAMDSLSFTEQEELNNLQKQNDELERQIYLLEQREKRKQKETEETFNKLMYDEFNAGTNQMGQSTNITHQDMLDTYMNSHQTNLANEEAAKEALVKAEESENEKEIKKAEKALEKAEKKTQATREYIDNKIDEYTKAADGIDYDLADDETKEYLDYIYDLEDRFNIAEGNDKAKTIGITRIFNMDQFSSQKEAIDGHVEALKSGDKTAADTIANIIKNNKALEKELNDIDLTSQDAIDYFTKIGSEAKASATYVVTEWEKASEAIDSVQDAYSTLTDVVKQYNSTGYLTLDNIQALLSLEPEYLAILQMENGQLSINQQAMETLLQTQLAKAEATVVDTAITQLNALSEQAKMEAVEGSTTAMSNAIPTLGTYATELSKVGQEALIASGKLSVLAEATNGAIAAGVDPEKIKAVFNGMNAQFAAIESVRTNLPKHFNKIVSTSSKSDGDTALEALQKRYERQIKNLEGQQTQIENQIEILEAKEEGVSADYYEKQINLEEEKIALYQKERDELLKLKHTDEVVDAIWEVEHAIQESTLSLIEFRKAIAELYATASERITEAYDRRQQLSDNKTSYIENEISIRETKGELIPTSAYDDLIAEAKYRRANAEAELNAQADLYWQGINNGELEKGSEEALDMLFKIEQKKLDMQEASKQEAEYIEQQKDAYIAYYDKMMEAYSHRNDLIQAQANSGQSYIDRLEVLNINVPDEAYEKMAEIQELANDGMERQIAFAKGELDNFKAEGIDENDSRYIDKIKEITDLENQLYEGETKVLEYAQQIIDNHLDRFNQVIDRINHATSQLENISGLLDNEDVATEDGEWTAAGLTQLGMAYQQREYNKQVATEYANEIKYLKDQLDAGQISEKEYTEQMQELEDGQWDAINAYKSAEDAIVDLNEARIDMIEEGLNKETEAYQELIDLKKEELDAERDLYSFRKDVQKQTKDIAALERRLASMSGSTDAATVAERKKLEAELREAREGLDDTYYNHSMDSQSQALDDELEAYTKSSEDYIKSLRESIKDTKLVVEQTFTEVLGNADIVLSEIDRLSGEYKITIDESLTQPWSHGSTSASTFAEDVARHMTSVWDAVNSYTSEEQAEYLGKKLKKPWDEAGNDEKSGPLAFSNKVKNLMDGIVDYAETNFKNQLKEKLEYGFNNENASESWGNGITTMLQGKISEAKAAGEKIAEHLNVQTSSYVGNPSGDTGSGGNPGGNPGGNTPPSSEDIKALQRILNDAFFASIVVDGKLGSQTTKAIKMAQETINKYYGKTVLSTDGKYGSSTRSTMLKYFDDKIADMKKNSGSSMIGTGVRWYTEYKQQLPAAFYAKGTLGTTRDQWAIDSEPWLGDELVLVPTAQGNLSYMRKGTGVLTAELTENMMKWGQMNPDAMSLGSIGTNFNMISNAIIQPNIDISFDALVRAENITEETLPAVKKLVSQELDKFTKQLNYSLKRVGGK